MAGSAPVVTANNVTASVLNPGGTADWTVDAQDATARTFSVSRDITDTQGNAATVTRTLTISDVLTYGPATSNDPAVTLVVDSVDPRVVHIQVAANA